MDQTVYAELSERLTALGMGFAALDSMAAEAERAADALLAAEERVGRLTLPLAEVIDALDGGGEVLSYGGQYFVAAAGRIVPVKVVYLDEVADRVASRRGAQAVPPEPACTCKYCRECLYGEHPRGPARVNGAVTL